MPHPYRTDSGLAKCVGTAEVSPLSLEHSEEEGHGGGNFFTDLQVPVPYEIKNLL